MNQRGECCVRCGGQVCDAGGSSPVTSWVSSWLLPSTTLTDTFLDDCRKSGRPCGGTHTRRQGPLTSDVKAHSAKKESLSENILSLCPVADV